MKDVVKNADCKAESVLKSGTLLHISHKHKDEAQIFLRQKVSEYGPEEGASWVKDHIFVLLESKIVRYVNNENVVFYKVVSRSNEVGFIKSPNYDINVLEQSEI